MLRVSGLNASGCEWKTGEEVGKENASWVDEKTWPFFAVRWVESIENKLENQPMAAEEKMAQALQLVHVNVKMSAAKFSPTILCKQLLRSALLNTSA